jgi:hypothetical protein
MYGTDTPTPGQVAAGIGKWLWVGAIIFALIVAFIFAAWQVGWIFAKANVGRSYSTTVQSQQYQTSLDNEMAQNISNIGSLAVTRSGIPASSSQQAVIRAQELNQVKLFCTESLQLVDNNPGYASLAATAQRNCTAGAPAADPPLAEPVPAGGQ